LRSISNSQKRANQDHESLRVSSFISTFFSSSCRRKDSKLYLSQWLQNVDRCTYVMFKADKEDRVEKHRCGTWPAGYVTDGQEILLTGLLMSELPFPGGERWFGWHRQTQSGSCWRSRGIVLIGDVEFSLGFSAELIWRAPNERDCEN
jgi:hypothetical protein